MGKLVSLYFALLAAYASSGTRPRIGAPAPSPIRDAEEIREIVFLRLYQDYCTGQYAPKVIFLNVGAFHSLKDPRDELCMRIRQLIPVVVRKASVLPRDVCYLEESELAKGTGVQLSVRSIEWRGTNQARVTAEFGKNSQFVLMPVYHVKRTRSRWRISGVTTTERDAPWARSWFLRFRIVPCMV